LKGFLKQSGLGVLPFEKNWRVPANMLDDIWWYVFRFFMGGGVEQSHPKHALGQ